MKKHLAMLLAAMMVLSLAACGNSASGESQKPTDTTVNNEQEAPNGVTSDPAAAESTVDLSELKFNTAEEVFVDENGRFYGGLEANNEEGAVLLDGSGVKIIAKELADSETNEATTCYKVSSSGKMLGGKLAPQYALFGVSNGVSSFWGEPTTFLGWYADKEQITKEVSEIQNAIANGDATYTLRYSAKTERKWMRIKILNE